MEILLGLMWFVLIFENIKNDYTWWSEQIEIVCMFVSSQNVKIKQFWWRILQILHKKNGNENALTRH